MAIGDINSFPMIYFLPYRLIDSIPLMLGLTKVIIAPKIASQVIAPDMHITSNLQTA